MVGFPIRTSPDQCLVDGSPELFAVTHVLHRFLAPRHPPLALISLKKQIIYSYRITPTPPKRRRQHVQDARACSAVLKGPPNTGTPSRETPAERLTTIKARQCGKKKSEDSLKTEEKTMCTQARYTRRDRIPTTNARYSDRRASAPTGVSCNRREQTPLID